MKRSVLFISILFMLVLSACASPTSAVAPTVDSPAAVSPTATVVSSAMPDLTANINAIEFGDANGKHLGSYLMTAPGEWVERNKSNEDLFMFKETQRDLTSIFLSDEARSVTVVLNLETMKVMVNDQESYVIETASQVDSIAPASPLSMFASMLDNKEVVLKIKNQSPEALHFFWVDYDGKEESYGTILGRGGFEQYTFFTHPWILRNKDGQIVAVYLATDAPLQTITISAETAEAAHQMALTEYPNLRSLNSEKAVTLTFVNESAVPLEIYWVNFDGKEEIIPGNESVAAGESTTLSSYFLHGWRLRDETGHIVYEYITTEAPEQSVTVSEEAVTASQDR